jgi:hypothetical protein
MSASWDTIHDEPSKIVSLVLRVISRHGLAYLAKKDLIELAREASDIELEQIRAGLETQGASKREIDKFVKAVGGLNGHGLSVESSDPQPSEPPFKLNKEKLPRATCANTRMALEALGIRCSYDRFHDKLLVSGKAISPYAGELSDHTCLCCGS